MGLGKTKKTQKLKFQERKIKKQYQKLVEKEFNNTYVNTTTDKKEEKPQKNNKNNPYQKSLKIWNEKKKELDEKKKIQEKEAEERRAKELKRIEKAKKYKLKTKKGQPVMKHRIQDILEKLQKQKTEN